jgi:hypothetical protein
MSDFACYYFHVRVAKYRHSCSNLNPHVLCACKPKKELPRETLRRDLKHLNNCLLFCIGESVLPLVTTAIWPPRFSPSFRWPLANAAIINLAMWLTAVAGSGSWDVIGRILLTTEKRNWVIVRNLNETLIERVPNFTTHEGHLHIRNSNL